MASGAIETFAEMFRKFVDAAIELAEHKETFIILFDAMVKFFTLLADVIEVMAKTNVPILNASLLEVYATLKLISLLGLGSLGMGLGKLALGASSMLGAKALGSAGKFYKGGQIMKGGARAPKGGMVAGASGLMKRIPGLAGRSGLAAAGRLGLKYAIGGTGVGLLAYGAAYGLDKSGLIDVPLVGDGRAGGGYVSPMAGGGFAGNKPYLVGEQGPELFMPGQAGQVLNNAETNNIMGKSVVMRNVTIGIDSFGGLA